MSQLQLSFEDFSQENGTPFWWASDLMSMIDIQDLKRADKMIEKAIRACMSAGIEWAHEFRRVDEGPSGQHDWKLSRFACYMTVMSGDAHNHQVAQAQVYFARMTERAEVKAVEEELERLVFRQDYTENQKVLNTTVSQHGVQNFAYFMNSGYRGMYNMATNRLAEIRGIPKEKLLDYMGRTELAANLFRITMVEEKIRNENIQGQRALEQAHTSVGKQVRRIVKDNTGSYPEELPKAKVIPEVRKSFKKDSRELKRIDSTKGKESNNDNSDSSEEVPN